MKELAMSYRTFDEYGTRNVTNAQIDGNVFGLKL